VDDDDRLRPPILFPVQIILNQRYRVTSGKRRSSHAGSEQVDGGLSSARVITTHVSPLSTKRLDVRIASEEAHIADSGILYGLFVYSEAPSEPGTAIPLVARTEIVLLIH